jgi:hypothetical protein
MCWSERVFLRTKMHLIKYFIKVTREVPPLVTHRVIPLTSHREDLDEKCQKEFNDNLDISFAIETLSLITTEKFCLILFRLVSSCFTSNQKYSYIWMILGFSSFQCYINFPLLTSYHGEISGLRWRGSTTVIKYRFPNNEVQSFFDPNNDGRLFFDPI